MAKTHNTDNHPASIRVPMEQTPTMLNDEMVMGAVIGNAVSRGSGVVLGGVVGGMMGEERMRREYEQGRDVKHPGDAGATVALSGLIGAAAGALILSVAGIGAVGVGIAALTGGALGGLIGKLSHDSAKKDYELATQYFDTHGGHYEGRIAEMQKAKENTISPEEAQQLHDRLNELEKRHADYAQHTDAHRGR